VGKEARTMVEHEETHRIVTMVPLEEEELRLISTALRFLLSSSRREEHVFGQIRSLLEKIEHSATEPSASHAA
jgi:hypothetical protein